MADEKDVEDEDVEDKEGVLPTCMNILASNVADEKDVEDEDVEDEEGVLPTCVNILASNVADEKDVEDEDVEDEEGVLPTCANILASSCLEYDACVKIALFSFKPNLFKRIQALWIHACSILRRLEK